MVQRIQCSCGKTFKIPEKFAGKKIRCLRCKQVLKIYVKPTSSPDLNLEGTVQCSGCAKVFPNGTEICLACGINLKTGALIYSPQEDASSEELDWSSEESFLQRRGLLQQLLDRLTGS